MMREWLESLGLGRSTTLFEENEVDFETLRALTENDLADLGLGFGPRRKLHNELIEMKAAKPEENAWQKGASMYVRRSRCQS